MELRVVLPLVFLTLLSKGLALQCYSCDYSNYLECWERTLCRPTIREKVTCYKFTVTDTDGNERYKKGCAKYIDYPNEECQHLEFSAKSNQQNIVGCFTCEYDNCNSAVSLSRFTGLAGLAMLFAYVF